MIKGVKNTFTDRKGEINYNSQNIKMWIKEYRVSHDIDVEFEDGFISYNKRYSAFKNGKIENKNFKVISDTKEKPKGVKNILLDRTGEVNYNHYGSKMTIIKYTNANNIIVEFENGYKTPCAYGDFKKGKPINLYDKMVYGVGYFGEGKYKCSENKIDTKEYRVWHSMIQRCYSESKQQQSCQTYIDVTVCDEWLCFQNFAKWYEENYYQIDDYKMQVEKDIIHKGNKVYSPENCVIVPEFINYLFIQQKSSRGEYPIGVSLCNNRLRARMKKLVDGKCKEIHLGYFDTPIQAFEKYKFEKEKHIKEVADQYKDKIPKKLYEAMYAYQVEITD